jgi:hypothetical protein
LYIRKNVWGRVPSCLKVTFGYAWQVSMRGEEFQKGRIRGRVGFGATFHKTQGTFFGSSYFVRGGVYVSQEDTYALKNHSATLITSFTCDYIIDFPIRQPSIKGLLICTHTFLIALDTKASDQRPTPSGITIPCNQ